MQMNASYALFIAIVFGALVWMGIGLVLNIAIPLIALLICCERLGSVYYEIAYWLPILTGAVFSGLAFIATRRTVAR
jgi:hypothetical protein